MSQFSGSRVGGSVGRSFRESAAQWVGLSEGRRLSGSAFPRVGGSVGRSSFSEHPACSCGFISVFATGYRGTLFLSNRLFVLPPDRIPMSDLIGPHGPQQRGWAPSPLPPACRPVSNKYEDGRNISDGQQIHILVHIICLRNCSTLHGV